MSLWAKEKKGRKDRVCKGVNRKRSRTEKGKKKRKTSQKGGTATRKPSQGKRSREVGK